MLSFDSSNHFQNLIAIHSGIGAVIFALLIFVAESLRDDETKDRARVLLRESFLFPLTVLEILVFFIFCWWDVNVLSLLSVILVAILTISSLWKLLSVLLNKSKFNAKRLALLQDRINQEINSAVEERYANNILLQGLGENKIELNYYPFIFDGDEVSGRHLFNADKNGSIADIRLDKLKEFAKIVEAEAVNKGYSFYKNNKVRKNSETAGVASDAVQTKVTSLQQKEKEYIHKKYHDVIKEDDKILMSVDLSVVNNPIVLARLARLVKDIFVIKQEDNFSEEIRLDVAGLRDQFITAIVEEKNGKIDDLAKMYIALAENFLKSISVYGGGYSYEQAKKERGDWFGGWNEIKWLNDDIGEIYRKAVKSGDQSIIKTVAYLPVAIAIRAISYGDQYVYQEFLKFPTILYSFSLNEENPELKQFMIDRSWRHLKEMSDYYIENQLRRKANKPEQIEKYAEFTIPLFSAFQSLMKVSFEKKDIGAFEVFLENFTTMYERFNSEEYTAEHIVTQIEFTDNPVDKKILEDKLPLQNARDKVAEDIKNKKNQVIFGLSAFILEKYKTNPADDVIKSHYESISSKIPSDFNELTKLYECSRKLDTERFWNWDDWEMVADGRVHIVDFNSKLDQLFVVKMLLILQHLTDDQIKDISLPPSRDMAFMAEDRNDNRTLMSLVKKISENQEQWSFVLPQQAFDKIPAFKVLLEKVKYNQENVENEFIKTVAISDNKLKEFNLKIIDAFGEGSNLRKIFNNLGAYDDRTNDEVGTSVPSVGYNQIDQKAAFIEEWYVHYGGWGEQYGTGIARSEDQIVFKQMIEDLEVKRSVTKANIITEISDFIRSTDLKNLIIIHTLEYLTKYDIKQDVSFIDRYHRDCPTNLLSSTDCYSGVLKVDDKLVPVVELLVNDSSLKNKILIIDLEKFISWIQYSPADNAQDLKYRDGIFIIKVADLNVDDIQRNKILNQKPKWLNVYKDKEEYLRRHVVVKVYEKFKIEPRDKRAGIMFVVKNGNTD